MEPDRIAELLEPFLSSGSESPALSVNQVQSISIYVDLLMRWNARMNLTSVREPEEIVTRHFGESLFAARHLFPNQLRMKSDVATEPAVVDLGSGAGFPGLPIRIWAPHIHLTLVESNQKKAIFLREVKRRLALANVDIFAGRANDFGKSDSGTNTPLEDRADIVTLRAVERFDSILPAAANLVASGGRLALLVSETQLERVRELASGLRWPEPIKIPCSTRRVLIIGRKESGL